VEKVAQNLGLSSNFQNLPKVNNHHTIGEKSPNLVTLVSVLIPLCRAQHQFDDFGKKRKKW
jgi:hypothetical protein